MIQVLFRPIVVSSESKSIWTLFSVKEGLNLVWLMELRIKAFLRRDPSWVLVINHTAIYLSPTWLTPKGYKCHYHYLLFNIREYLISLHKVDEMWLNFLFDWDFFDLKPSWLYISSTPDCDLFLIILLTKKPLVIIMKSLSLSTWNVQD